MNTAIEHNVSTSEGTKTREEREKGDSDKNNKIIISLKIRSNKSSIEKLLNSQQNEIVLHQNNCTVHVNIQCKPQFSPEKFLELSFLHDTMKEKYRFVQMSAYMYPSKTLISCSSCKN